MSSRTGSSGWMMRILEGEGKTFPPPRRGGPLEREHHRAWEEEVEDVVPCMVLSHHRHWAGD